MNNQSNMTRLKWCCAALIFCFPVTILIADDIGSTAFFLLAIIGLIFPFFNKDCKPLQPEGKWLIAAVVFYFAVATLSYLLGDFGEAGIKNLGRYARFLLVIPIFLLLIRVRPFKGAVWYGFAMGAIIAGMVSLDQIWWHLLFSPTSRASGSVNAIMFGDIALVLAIMNLANLGYFWEKRHWLIALPLSAAVLGFTASFLSGSRGGWVAIPALILLLWKTKQSIRAWQLFSITAIILIISFSAYYEPQTGVKTRIEEAYNQTALYFKDNTQENSISIRIELWKAGWEIFKEHPIFGVGVGNFAQAMDTLVEKGKIEPYVKKLNQPHNEYFLALASRGLSGLLALSLLFLVPFRIFFIANKSRSLAMQSAGLAGMVLVISFMCFGLTESIFDRALTITFYAFSLTTILSVIYLYREKERSERHETLAIELKLTTLPLQEKDTDIQPEVITHVAEARSAKASSA